MPLYDFRCRACGATFDRMRSMAQADDACSCDCGSTDTARLISRIAKRTSVSTSVGGSLPMAGGAPAPSGGGGCCGGGCCG